MFQLTNCLLRLRAKFKQRCCVRFATFNACRTTRHTFGTCACINVFENDRQCFWISLSL